MLLTVDTEVFLGAADEHNADLILMSALLTTTMKAMEASVRAIREKRPNIKVIVGGAPVNQEFADAIGANGYADDAPGAINLVRAIV